MYSTYISKVRVPIFASLNFFSLSFRNCISCALNCDDWSLRLFKLTHINHTTQNPSIFSDDWLALETWVDKTKKPRAAVGKANDFFIGVITMKFLRICLVFQQVSNAVLRSNEQQEWTEEVPERKRCRFICGVPQTWSHKPVWTSHYRQEEEEEKVKEGERWIVN